MNVKQLKLFVSAYRFRGFTEAAKDCNSEPSAISRAIAALEAELGVRLFHRTTRHVEPTDEGHLFFNRVEAVVEELETARAELADRAAKPAGRLRVTASVSFGQKMIVPLLRKFHAAYPDITVELNLSDQRIDLVEHQVDIGIRHGALADSTLVARKLRDVTYHVVASPEYLTHYSSVSQPEQILEHKIVTMPFAGFDSSWSLRSKTRDIVVSIKPHLVVSNAEAVRQCVVDGLGMALLADWLIEEDLQTGRLLQLLPEWTGAGASFDNSIWLILPSRSYVPAKARVFRDFLLKQLGTDVVSN